MTTSASTTTHRDRPVEERGEAARRYVDQRRAFHGHIGGFATGMFIMFSVNLVTNVSAGTAGQWNAWWSVWALLGWSIGIAVHGFVLWLNRPAPSLSTAQEIEASPERHTQHDDREEK